MARASGDVQSENFQQGGCRCKGEGDLHDACRRGLGCGSGKVQAGDAAQVCFDSGRFSDRVARSLVGQAKNIRGLLPELPQILSQIFDIKGGREKFDYVNGGRAAWVAKIDRIKLADVTPDKVNKWRIAFVKKAGGNPVKQRRARITCNSMMRQAKSLFSPELLAHVTVHKPDKLPFDGVAFYEREIQRYRSKIDIEALIQAAVRELPQEQLKIFLLATMAGLRRNEIDKLQWSAFRWTDGVIRIEETEHFAPKSSDGAGDVPIDKELLAMFRGWHAKATGAFVIEADAEPRSATTYAHYRAQADFDALTAWLRAKGVTAIKPLHELRKEFGSQLCAKYGIYAASRMLRHADIRITAQHYFDTKGARDNRNGQSAYDAEERNADVAKRRDQPSTSGKMTRSRKEKKAHFAAWRGNGRVCPQPPCPNYL